jgi:pyridoxal phosphate enzyme (YggS family)
MIETIGTAQKIAARAALLRARIDDAARRAGRDPEAVTLIAVTKTMSVETIRAAALAGIRDIGENKVQEASLKHGELVDQAELRWHLIGHLQRNKARRATDVFSAVQSVDSLELATALSEHSVARGKILDVFFQVNVSGETEKFGFAPSRFREQAGLLADLPGLRRRGLMTIAPEGADEATLRAVFRDTRQLGEETADAFDPTYWNSLSMGMSNDFEIAVEEGATHVRVGRAIFGERTETVQG